MQGNEVSISEAARRLADEENRAIDRSTLSRYVKGHADALKPRRRGRETVVDWDKLLQHRRENINLDHDEPPAPAARQPQALPPPERDEDDEPQARHSFAGNDAKTRSALAVAQLKEIELEERLGSVTPVSEIRKGAEEAVALMSAEESRIVNAQAEQMAAVLGVEPRVIRPHLKALVRQLRTTLSNALTLQLAALAEGDDSEDDTRQ